MFLNNIQFTILFCCLFTFHTDTLAFNLTLLHQHPNPEAVAQDLQRRVNASISRRHMLSTAAAQCLTGNPIDDCWKCEPNWANNRQRLADCAVGFGQGALGGKGGEIYTVTDASDMDMLNPTPGTLRHAVIQDVPLWIVFASNMKISLKHELMMNSYKTIDGRGVNIDITGGGCITIESITNVIIHNIHIYDCVPTENANIRWSPSQSGSRGRSEGDGITISSSSNIWVDHCSLSHCTDGLIDATRGSTAITISNNYFTHHDKVMLLGHVDTYVQDSGMQVTVAFNHFGEGLVERMPRCRRGYFHVVNNDYSEWKMYAIGGSASPTINSQGNRYTAPADSTSKEVTKRMDTEEKVWSGWNWRTDGDIFVNDAFFVPSGAGASSSPIGNQYDKASSMDPKPASIIDQLTLSAGRYELDIDSGGSRDRGDGGDNDNISYSGGSDSTGKGGDTSGITYDHSASAPTKSSPTATVFMSIVIILSFLRFGIF